MAASNEHRRSANRIGILARWLVCAIIAILLGGCSHGGWRHFPVVGFGIVSVRDHETDSSRGESDISVRRTRTLGVTLGAGPDVTGVIVGFADVGVVSVNPAANVLFEARHSPCGGVELVLYDLADHDLSQPVVLTTIPRKESHP